MFRLHVVANHPPRLAHIKLTLPPVTQSVRELVNRIPFEKPANYDERNYELLLRNLEAIPAKTFVKNEQSFWNYMPWINSMMPNRKTDTNNRTGFSTDFIGQNWAWPEASYEEREVILKAHLDYQKGLMWTLANNPRVPDPIRNRVAQWGTCRDEFTDGI